KRIGHETDTKIKARGLFPIQMKVNSVEKAVYRALLRHARKFDHLPVAKALIHRLNVYKPPEEPRKLLYYAALDALLGRGARYLSPERTCLPLRDLIRDFSRGREGMKGSRADDLEDATNKRFDIDSNKESSLAFRTHFSGLPSVEGLDKEDRLDAGFSALREMSSKWATAKRLGLPNAAQKDRARRSPMSRRRGRSHSSSRKAEKQSHSVDAGDGGLGVVEPAVDLEAGVFLLSHPMLELPPNAPGPGQVMVGHGLAYTGEFHRRVVIILRHGPDGTAGVVVNRPTKQRLGQSFNWEGPAEPQ
ncbi:unnamed protein product, partial [Discosporangium mesarthrocarpum]